MEKFKIGKQEKRFHDLSHSDLCANFSVPSLSLIPSPKPGRVGRGKERGKFKNRVHISAGAVVVRPGKAGEEVLVMHRQATNSWHLPKGTQSPGESILETALREVEEETGVAVAVERYLGRLVSLREDGKPKLTHYYLARPSGLSELGGDSEHDRVLFAPIKKARQLLRKTSLFEKEYQTLDWISAGNKPLFIFDLDHTLFDTARFKADMFSSLKGFNIPRRAVERAYEELMNPRGKFLYDYHVGDHLRILRRKYVFPLEAGKKAFFKIFTRSRRYVYPKVFDLLAFLKAKNSKLVLLTRGNRRFNLRKSNDSGLRKYFHTVIAGAEDKVLALREIVKKHGPAEVWFIGDSVEELKEAGRLYPEINCVLKRRAGKPQPGKEGFAGVSEIGDLFRFLE